MLAKKIKPALKLIFAIMVFGLLVFAFLPEPIRVDISKVESGELLVTLEGEGKTRIHDIYVVSTPIDGRITRIDSEPGDRVFAGKTIIANMHPANPAFLDKRSEIQAQADVLGAKAALALAVTRVKQARAQLDYDEQDFKRIQSLYQKHSISQAALEQAELKLITLKSNLETAKSNRKVMQSQLLVAQALLLKPSDSDSSANDACHICIHSPVDGQVLRILNKSERIVPVGTPLVEIGNPEHLEVIVEMLSTHAVKVNIGDDALIKRWGGGQDINARVRMIEPSGFTKISALGVEEQRVNVILDFMDPIEKWAALGDAFRVEADIIIDRAEQAIQVPLSALFRLNEQWSVFKVVDDVAQLQAVDRGRSNDRFCEITDGLKVGDQVITHPSNSVKAGVKVVLR